MGTEGSLTRYARGCTPEAPGARRRRGRSGSASPIGSAARSAAGSTPRILRRAGADDVVQSLFASFFAAPPGPDGPPRNRDELWRLLVHFTMCKVANTADHHRARRRDVRRERPLGTPQTARRVRAGVRARGPPRPRPRRRGHRAEEFARLLGRAAGRPAAGLRHAAGGLHQRRDRRPDRPGGADRRAEDADDPGPAPAPPRTRPSTATSRRTLTGDRPRPSERSTMPFPDRSRAGSTAKPSCGSSGPWSGSRTT